MIDVNCTMLCGGYQFKITKRHPGSIYLLYYSVHLCVCVSVCSLSVIYCVCNIESRKGVTIYATAITCLATPPATRVHDLWCMRYLYVMCVHVSVCEF